MTQTYRVRQLSTTGAGEAEAVGGRGAGAAFSALSAQAGAVYAVEASDEVLAHDDIIARLRNGDLRGTNLVFLDGTWTTFSQSIPFGDDIADSGTQNTKQVLMGLGAVAVVGFFILIRILAG